MSRRKNRAPDTRKNFSPKYIKDGIEKYQHFLSAEEFIRLKAALLQPLESALRINPLKIDPSQAIEAWKTRYTWKVRPVPYCDTGWWVTDSTIPISQTMEHRLGYFYIQDAASMLPVELFDWQDLSNPLVLDMAASPGGKTTHLVSKIGDKGLVLANDSSHSRITALRLVLQKWGAVSSVVTSFPGEKFGDWFPETFDRVLLDAPCSMQNLRSTESHPVRPISEKERTSLAHRQERLLTSAFLTVKPGGQVVYSTCTLAPEENEAVLQTLLNRFSPKLLRIDNLNRCLPVPAPGLASIGEKEFDPQVQNAARLWPHIYDTSGFFAALITKLDSVSTLGLPAPERLFDKTGLERVNQSEKVVLDRQLTDQFGYHLSASLQTHNLSLWKYGSAIFAISDLYLSQFCNLPFEAAGLLLGDQTAQDFVLSHEWVIRFGMEFEIGKLILPDETIQAWSRGEDIHDLSSTGFPTGRMVIVVDKQGRLLGRGKVQAQRIKNLLPRRMV